jgi:YesN/AraC family two-component response regulator
LRYAPVMKTLLVVDDEVEIAKALRRLLRSDFKVELAHSGSEALTRLEQGPVDLVLSDFRMPGMNGAEFLSVVQERWPSIRRVMLSGFTDFTPLLSTSGEPRVCEFLRKPWDDADLVAVLIRQLNATSPATDPSPRP